MRLLFLGDVVGRAGRRAVIEALPGLRRDWGLDFVVVNAENAAAGFGLTAAIADDILAAGADCITLGDHAFDQKEMLAHIEREKRILRPLNLARQAPGQGVGVYEATRGRRVAVIAALGQVFMKRPFADPFSALDAVLKSVVPGAAVAATMVDFHAEATSEKMAMGHWCDGRASLVAGTHTHVPTADAMILPRGTAYLSDAGMCGDYDSVIGMDKAEPMRRFITGMAGNRFEPAMGVPAISGVAVETDETTGMARSVAPVRLGGRLAEARPGWAVG